jgi:hypothetical protein
MQMELTGLQCGPVPKEFNGAWVQVFCTHYPVRRYLPTVSVRRLEYFLKCQFTYTILHGVTQYRTAFLMHELRHDMICYDIHI